MKSIGLLILLLVLAPTAFAVVYRWQMREGERFALVLARDLRRLGRLFWAMGEAVEVGYLHGCKVKSRFPLDISGWREVLR